MIKENVCHMIIEEMERPSFWIAFWIVVISLVAVIATWVDKKAAGNRRRRIPERTLLMLAALGGGVAMYITMLLIRHKTRKAKFMVGIPAILLTEAAAGAAIWYFLLR